MFMMFGVAIFSYIMGNFVQIFAQAKLSREPINYGDDLSRFFGVLKSFNEGEEIDKKLKNSIESFFIYRW